MEKTEREIKKQTLPKCPTGIIGLDEITTGGLPKGRPTLVCGNAGCGKTLLAMEFLVHGARDYDEPGVFISFEESVKDLAENVLSLGFDLKRLIKNKKMVIDHIQIERDDAVASGEFDLEGLFIRLAAAIDSIGAKRVVLDTIESLFDSIPNPVILRSELIRLFLWLKNKGVTAIITSERGDDALSGQNLDEYVSDCVILLDHRVSNQKSTRRLRIVKYRGTIHGTNEYPFVIDEKGFSVFPLTSIGLKYKASTKRISSGIPDLDQMLEGKGYFQGSSVLVSGAAGAGKTSIAAHFAEANCRKGDRVLFFCYEESPDQIKRNMLSIGIDLDQWEKKGLLQFHASRSTMYGMDMHLAVTHKLVSCFKPKVVIYDPITTFSTKDDFLSIENMLVSLVDFLKMRHISSLFTHILAGSSVHEHTDIFISSLIDTWLLLKNMERNGEQKWGLYVIKSRGMANSKQIREFQLTNKGIKLQNFNTHKPPTPATEGHYNE